MTSRRIIKLAVLLTASMAGSLSLRAYPEYLKVFASDPSSRKELRQQCSTCHVSSKGGGALNDFGKAFQAGGHKVTEKLKAAFPDRFEAQQPSIPVTFVANSDSQAVVEIGGKKYLVDTRSKTVSEMGAELASTKTQTPAPQDKTQAPQAAPRDNVYQQGDVRLVNLPTAKPIPKGAMVMEFTHRFPFEDYDTTDGTGLFGLDGFAVPSFGIAYGVTDRIQVGASRSPSALGRPIMVFAGLNLLDENKKNPLTATVRVALEGRDHFHRNFTTSFELAIARSITNKAQLYLVPTFSINNRPFGPTTRNLAGANTFSLGVGGAFNIRPTVALLAEANWRLNEAGKLGTRSPVLGFGIQKETASRKHAFSLVFSNGVGTTFAQRSASHESLLGAGSDNSLAIGFNISRRIF